jgi:hypothetical protein
MVNRGGTMKLTDFNFVQTAGVRRAVVSEGDIRGDIEFQNDINLLLARMEGTNPPLQALGWLREPVAEPSQATAASANPSRMAPRQDRHTRLAAMLGLRPAAVRRTY